MKSALPLLLIIILSTSCSSYKYIASGPRPDSIYTSDDVIVLQDSSLIKDINPIGFVLAKSNNESKVWRKAKKLAASNGSNAIFVVRAEEISKGQKMANLWLSTGYRGKYKLFCYELKQEQE